MTMRNAQVLASTGADPTGELVRPHGDFFATSPAATRALLAVEAFPGVILEPACGNGAMARVLAEAPGVVNVIATDLYDRGYGIPGLDFLRCPAVIGIDHIVTNPPFDLIESFARKALELAPKKVAIFARLAFLEGQRRGVGLWRTHPPARVWVFSKRPQLARNGDVYQTGLIAFCWIVWENGHKDAPQLGWLT